MSAIAESTVCVSAYLHAATPIATSTDAAIIKLQVRIDLRLLRSGEVLPPVTMPSKNGSSSVMLPLCHFSKASTINSSATEVTNFWMCRRQLRQCISFRVGGNSIQHELG